MRQIIMLLAVSLLFICCHTDKQKGVAGSSSVNGDMSGNANESANQTEYSPLDYVTWVKSVDHGLYKEKTIDDLSFSAQFKPYEYIACLEERTPQMKESVLKKKKSELEDMVYIDLKIGIKNGEGELLKQDLTCAKEYSDRINYFSFQMQKDIYLVSNKDTIPCSLFHFERAYDVAPYSVFLLGFSKTNKTEKSDMTLVFHDNTFHKGIIKISFIADDLVKIPKLKTI
jgi:hypothetical protein